MSLFKKLHPLLLLSSIVAPLSAPAQDFDDVEIETQQVSDHIYMLTGRGGNIGLSAGDDGVFIVDDQFAPLTDKIKAAIKKINDSDVRFVINTHWHGDHTGGNENLGKAGATIIAHDHVRARMQRGVPRGDQTIKLFELNPEPSIPGALPVITFNDELSLHLNGEAVRVYHVPNGHTDGDSIIHFPASNVLHLGDLYFSIAYPYVDRDSGGSFQGLQAAIKFALTLSDEHTRIIPGHGPLATRSDLRRYQTMLDQVRAAVQKQVDKGADLATAIAAKPTAHLDEEWGHYFITGDQITAIVWQSLMLDSTR